MKMRPIPCPCENCNRWYECNGVDTDNCPLCQEWRERMENRRKLIAALQEDKTESGLLEEC